MAAPEDEVGDVKAPHDEDRPMRGLFLVGDRRRALLGRSGRQRRRRTRLLRLRIGTGRLGRRRGRALTTGLRLGRRLVLIRSRRRRLQRRGRPRPLRVAGPALRPPKTPYGKPPPDQRGGEQHIPPLGAPFFLPRHLLPP